MTCNDSYPKNEVGRQSCKLIYDEVYPHERYLDSCAINAKSRMSIAPAAADILCRSLRLYGVRCVNADMEESMFLKDIMEFVSNFHST